MANTQFIGNNDYRGYLNYLGSQGDATAKTLIGGNGSLGMVDNLGQITHGAGVLNPNILNANTKYYQQYQGLNAPASPAQSPGSIYGGGGGQVAPAKVDLAGINSQARAAAENAVNPYYTKKLNDFLAQQGAIKQQYQTQHDTDVKNLQDTLANQLQGNEVTRGRSITDEATQQGLINQNADHYQQDTGTKFDEARLAAARGQAAAGTLGSAAGARQTFQADTQRNIDESRQGQQFQQSRDQQALLKGRSLEDLLKSDELSKTSETKGEKQSQFDLENYLRDLQYKTDTEVNQNKLDQTSAYNNEVSRQSKLLFNNYLNTLTNPVALATANRYSGSF